MWGQRDEFHMAWRKLEGDFILQACVEFPGAGVDPHRKAGLIVRGSLLSFDGKMLGISDQSTGANQSTIFTVPTGGGTPKRITPLTPRCLHGGSPRIVSGEEGLRDVRIMSTIDESIRTGRAVTI